MDVRNVEHALQSETATRFPGPELAELSELACADDSWLGRLLAGWQALQAPPVPKESKVEADTAIIVSSAVSRVAEWSLSDAEEALAALAESVARYREGMVEW